MKQTGKLIGAVVAAFLLLAGCGGNSAEKEDGGTSGKPDKIELHISAAASLTDALDDFKNVYEQEHDGVKLTFMYGGSGKLATMIDNGAPADLFLSASGKDMDMLDGKGLIVDSTRKDFTKNALVLIAGKDEQKTVQSFEQIDPAAISHLVIGEPESVPAGRYTKEVFEQVGLWKPLQDKLVLASDVRQVLTQVEMGNAEYGVVYSSDAFISDKVKTVAEADADWHAPIVYPGAVLTNAEHPEEAQQFFDSLLGEDGQAVLAKHGFK